MPKRSSRDDEEAPKQSRGEASATAAPDGGGSPLIRRLLSHLVAEDTPEGAHLTEQGLADALNVSRTPIRKALTDLHAEGIVAKVAHRGYFLARPARTLFAASLDFPSFDEDALFERVALDHLQGVLPRPFSERDVISRYGMSARMVRRVLNALCDEKVIFSDEDGKWRFNPFLLTNEASLASYEYRLATEPRILLLPTFRVKRDLIRACRDEHIRLLTLATPERTGRIAFRVDAAFHEAIATCGGNPFFHSGVAQHNRMRQILEYRDAPDEGRMLVWLKEHLDILEAVVANELQEASALMRTHLANAMRHRKQSLDLGRQR
ncbi:GntR family transcriptional regulator [Methylocapsa sp. S129]|uniref:GntR family transcriptional regulator n=1 Tax=Methylocapsa sp. S129 TaxID=1641869 RepID=UPI00131CBF90|nr:GntR family transcriptional regulator [Methylocapsa sp. S129]